MYVKRGLFLGCRGAYVLSAFRLEFFAFRDIAFTKCGLVHWPHFFILVTLSA